MIVEEHTQADWDEDEDRQHNHNDGEVSVFGALQTLQRGGE